MFIKHTLTWPGQRDLTFSDHGPASKSFLGGANGPRLPQAGLETLFEGSVSSTGFVSHGVYITPPRPPPFCS